MKIKLIATIKASYDHMDFPREWKLGSYLAQSTYVGPVTKLKGNTPTPQEISDFKQECGNGRHEIVFFRLIKEIETEEGVLADIATQVVYGKAKEDVYAIKLNCPFGGEDSENWTEERAKEKEEEREYWDAHCSENAIFDAIADAKFIRGYKEESEENYTNR